MRRIALLLLMLVACADVAARDVRQSSPDSGACPDGPAVVASTRPESRKPAPARDATPPRVRPSVHSDAATDARTRWHSFLPGMFR